ncbi:MAG: hypothetical protein AB7S61_03145 [Methanoregulaceae archaeon]
MTIDEIDRGFAALETLIRMNADTIGEESGRVRQDEAALLARMGETAAQIVPLAGLEVMARGKVNASGELFDQAFFPEKMLLLARGDPMPFRPDDAGKSVTDQFCVLRHDGTFAELMYSNDTVLIDSYLASLSAEDALGIYGPELLLMLYRALRQYLEGQDALLSALRTTLEFVHG